MTSQQEIKQPSLLDALIPIVSLVLMMGTAVYLFSDHASFGPNRSGEGRVGNGWGGTY